MLKWRTKSEDSGGDRGRRFVVVMMMADSFAVREEPKE